MYRFILVAVSIGRLTNAFDMGHYAKPYQAARKEYTEALREVRLTEGAYRASKGAYIAASETYNDNLDDERKEEHDHHDHSHDHHGHHIPKPKPSVCKDVWHPVCCKDVQYSNGCFANKAGLKKEECHKGECEHRVCPEIWHPVCCKGVTYSNDCYSSRAGLSSDECHSGECECNNYGCSALDENREQCKHTGRTCRGATFSCDNFLLDSPRMCCKAMTPSCMSCDAGLDVDTYCKCNPLKHGCPIKQAQEATKKLGKNYEFDFKFECFCPQAGQWHRVRVIDGKVEQASAPKVDVIRDELDAIASSLVAPVDDGASLAIKVPTVKALDIGEWTRTDDSDVFWSVTLEELVKKSAQWSLGHRGKFSFETNQAGQLEGLKTWMDMDPRIADEEISIAVKDILPLRLRSGRTGKKLRSIDDAIKSAEEEHMHMEMELRSMRNN